MTNAQIKHILNSKNLNVELNVVTTLPKVHSIILIDNRTIRPSDNDYFCFDHNNDLFCEYTQKGNSFEMSTIYPYSSIYGIVAVNAKHKK